MDRRERDVVVTARRAAMARGLLKRARMNHRFLPVSMFAFLSLLDARPAAAQGVVSESHSEVIHSSPRWRLDIDLPAGGGGVWIDPASDGGFIPPMAIGAWLTHESGHGAMLRVSSLMFAFATYFVSAAWGAVGIEAAYQYAFMLAGDLRAGITFAPYAGLFVGAALSDGAALGPLGGANLSFHIWGFELGIDLAYRAIVSQDEYDGQVHLAHAATAMLRLGFSFWGY